MRQWSLTSDVSVGSRRPLDEVGVDVVGSSDARKLGQSHPGVVEWEDVLVPVFLTVDIFLALGAREIALTLDLVTEQLQRLQRIIGGLTIRVHS